jgi:PAS domain S-box-containing protein
MVAPSPAPLNPAGSSNRPEPPLPAGAETGSRTADLLGPEAYRALYDNSPDGVLFTVPDGRVLAANPAACQILGRTEAEICSAGRQGMADHTDERWGAMVAERGRTGSVRGVARMIRGDGSVIEVEVSTRIFRRPSGEQRTCTIVRDVTDRVTLESELRDSRERLAEAERIAQTGSWELDMASGQISWSDGMFELYALSPDEFVPTLGAALQRVYPDDRERVDNALRRALRERSSFTLEYRALRADGRLRTLQNRGEVVVDEAGEAIRMVGIAHDITDARLAQEALHRTSSDLERRAIELQKLALQTAPEPKPEPRALLTPRQREVLGLVAEGLTSAQIATRLFLTEATVKWHVKQILTKTASSNRAEAVARILGAPQ